MKSLRVLPAFGCSAAVSLWSAQAWACAGPGQSQMLMEALVVWACAIAIGVSSMATLRRGSRSLRKMARDRPSSGLRFAAIISTVGFALVSVFTVVAVLSIGVVIH